MNSRDRTIALLGVIAMVMLILTFIGYAALSGRSIESVLPTMLGFATPTIVSFVAAASGRAEMGKMQDKVNGNYDDLATRNEDLTAALAQAVQQFTAQTGQMPALRSDSEAVNRAVGEASGRHRAPGGQP